MRYYVLTVGCLATIRSTGRSVRSNEMLLTRIYPIAIYRHSLYGDNDTGILVFGVNVSGRSFVAQFTHNNLMQLPRTRELWVMQFECTLNVLVVLNVQSLVATEITSKILSTTRLQRDTIHCLQKQKYLDKIKKNSVQPWKIKQNISNTEFQKIAQSATVEP